jgi:hypothetical protein
VFDDDNYVVELRELAVVTRWTHQDLDLSWMKLKDIPLMSFERFSRFVIEAQRLNVKDLYLLSLSIKRLVINIKEGE